MCPTTEFKQEDPTIVMETIAMKVKLSFIVKAMKKGYINLMEVMEARYPSP